MIIAINIKYTKYISGKVRFQNKWRAMATLPPPLPLGVGPAFLILNFNRRSHGSCDYYFCSFTSWKLWKLWPATWEVFLLPFKIDIQWRLHCFDFTKKNDSCCIKSQIILNYFLDEFSESNFFMMYHAINSISSYLLKLLWFFM